MLTSIELSGFKSFADKTRMDFSEGISILVGPNGSGKSNIVDAIKWVLGEQSVKKLRGFEMTDVIFGGSETRPPANMAEVTLSFDNKRRFFTVDSDEVHLTRRIYRSGESEYLVNRQTSRLKDIRDLLTGSGLGAQAYSIIEQGRVGLLLQSTSLQRRGILEEAAGTARFNAKSQEALRRLERVEQNLLRLSDIVKEIESQLRQTKSQAGKAQQYRQYSTRIQTLRTEASLIQWRLNQTRRDALDQEIRDASADYATLEKDVEIGESSQAEHADRLERVERALRSAESELATVREKSAAGRSTIALQSRQIGQLEKEIADHGAQILALNSRSGDAEEMARKTSDEIFELRKQRREIVQLFERHQSESDRLTSVCDELQKEFDSLQTRLQENKLAKSRLSGEIKGFNSRRDSVVKTLNQRQERLEGLRAQLADLLSDDDRLKGDLDELVSRLEQRRHSIETSQRERKSTESELGLLRQEYQDLNQRLTVTSERVLLLSELVRKNEGLSPGVKSVLAMKSDPTSPFRHVFELVAELIRVNPEAAPLIELALGQKAQYLVVSPDPELFAYIEKNASRFSGRVGFIWLSPDPDNDYWKSKGEFDGLPGVLGRADRFVETKPEFAYLVYRLLGKTWIVENLRTAKLLFRRSDGWTDFVTITGETLLSNGTLMVGPTHAPSGLITRRTELRTLSEQKTELERLIDEKKGVIESVKTKGEQIRQNLANEEKEFNGLQEKSDKLRLRRVANRERDKRTQSEFNRLSEEIGELTKERSGIDADLESANGRLRELNEQSAELEASSVSTREALNEAEKERKQASKQTTNLKIDLAKIEERLGSLDDRKKQFEESLSERKKLLKDHLRRLESLRKRRDDAEMTILRTESAFAHWFDQKEKITGERNSLFVEKSGIAGAKKEVEDRLNVARQELANRREEIRFKEMEVDRLTQDLRSLADRMKEDYGIDLSTEAIKPGEATDPDAENATSAGPLENCLREIETLKGKIKRLGSVNLEAIETLEHLETRFTTCSHQYNDLLSARRSIQKIIEKTNNHRQKLFEETFNAVKIYFCDIFQRFFGGGHADIIFEDPDNPMESGIEIVARPPGKELKNVTLLSGGEKTLTCVAFLLAIFQYRSCPICILDEVDAALDELNVDRFNSVIRDFGTETQFFMITHSKKTMSIAKTLYGITMQDSGVSKLIAVQFDDVGEDGEILIQDGKDPSGPQLADHAA